MDERLQFDDKLGVRGVFAPPGSYPEGNGMWTWIKRHTFGIAIFGVAFACLAAAPASASEDRSEHIRPFECTEDTVWFMGFRGADDRLVRHAVPLDEIREIIVWPNSSRHALIVTRIASVAVFPVTAARVLYCVNRLGRYRRRDGE